MEIKIEITDCSNIDNETLSKIVESINKLLPEEEFEKPQHPEDVILVDHYLVNANVNTLLTPESAKALGIFTKDKSWKIRNMTWLVSIPRVKNHSDTVRRNTALKLIAEKYGDRIHEMEIIELKLENYVPVEIPGSLFYNLTLE
ncbi:MAG: hypothetical protein WC479_04535 [Candidatus Izemoplasmatales bacterium]|jgi:hypothetical protein